MKIQLFLIFFLKSVISISYGYKMVSSSIENIALSNYMQCYNEALTDETICGPGAYICELMEGSEDIYVITGVDFSKPGNPLFGDWCYFENFAVFTNLTTIYVGDESGKIRGNGEALKNIGTLKYLKKVFYKYFDELRSSFTFLDALEELYIGTVTVDVPSSMFESKLKTLTIENAPSFSKLTIPNLNLKNLKIGVENFTQEVSDTFSKILVNLENFELSYTKDGSASVSPVLGYFNYLKTLTINGYSKETNWEFSTLDSDLSNSLKSLTLTNSVLKLSNGFDFSNYLSGFKLTINGYVSSFSNCSKCIKLPSNSIVESDGNLELGSIDFKNVISFTSKNNQIYQPLPDLEDISTNYKSLKSFYITDSSIYGSIPESYCQLPNDFSLSNNELSFLPTCFKCDLSLEPKIFPNGYYLSSRDCSEYSLNQITQSTTFSTKTGGVLQFNGSSLGWEYIFDSKTFSLDIPNKEFNITIPKGTGKNIKKQLTLNNYQNSTITYSYNSPTISSYEVININEKSVLIIYGSDFDYENVNLATFTEKEDSKKSLHFYFENQNVNNSFITSTIADVYSNLVSNKVYELYFTVGEQQSNTIQISITKPDNNNSSTIGSDSSINNNNSSSSSNHNSTSSTDKENNSLEKPSTSSKLNLFLNFNVFIILFIFLLLL
ncbi:hypothetical protein RB653_010482 [Dictyostelium firmibasis]|uniref:Uncharacterized protein n=1 Tax=Dictyostelium firmibasis TaxID=79012 RepID=A0AAN7YPW2_9MYCE